MSLPLRDDGWTLDEVTEADIDKVMTWLSDAEAVDDWGGPAFRFPFTARTFREDCRIGEMDSYSLRDSSNQLAAFGQSYEREGRGHLARLVSNPSLRRRGAGGRLIRMIISALAASYDYDEYSLFVYRHNTAACACYLSQGFVVREFPEDAPMPDKCLFLTRRKEGESDDS